MFEKIKERFDPQKSDDAFVEAATNASARQETIDKLVKARAKFNRLLMIIVLLYLFTVLIELIQLFIRDPSGISRSPGASNQGFLVVLMLGIYAGLDLQIKFLKALEASAGGVTQTIN